MALSAQRRRAIADLAQEFLEAGSDANAPPQDFMLALAGAFVAAVGSFHATHGAPFDVMAAFQAAAETLQEGTAFAFVETAWSRSIDLEAKAN